jgi:hypothetical protein
MTIENRGIHKMIHCSHRSAHPLSLSKQAVKYDQQISKKGQGHNGTQKQKTSASLF